MARKPIKKLIILVVGLLCAVIGLILAFLPFIPGGFLFLPLGLVLLALLFPKVDAFIDRLVRRWPKLQSMMQKAQDRVARFVGDI